MQVVPATWIRFPRVPEGRRETVKDAEIKRGSDRKLPASIEVRSGHSIVESGTGAGSHLSSPTDRFDRSGLRAAVRHVF